MPAEMALLGVKGGKPTFNGKYDNGIYSYPIEHSKGRFHPTQKSLPLIKALDPDHRMKAMLSWIALPVFCTTGAAATRLLLIVSFIGCELERLKLLRESKQASGVFAGGAGLMARLYTVRRKFYWDEAPCRCGSQTHWMNPTRFVGTSVR